MTDFTLRLKEFVFYDEDPERNTFRDGRLIEPVAEGSAVFEMAAPGDPERPIPWPWSVYFHKGEFVQRPGDVSNIWGWDGNREAPSLAPSILLTTEMGYPYRVHLFIRKGKIDLLADSTVRLAD